MTSSHRARRPRAALSSVAPWAVVVSGVVALLLLLAVTLWTTLRPEPAETPRAGGAELFVPAVPSAGVVTPPVVPPAAPLPTATGAAPTGPASGRGGEAPAGTTVSPSRSRASGAPATTTGPAATTPATAARDAFSTVQAESFDARSGVSVVACDEGGKAVGAIGDGDWIRYDDVDFGSSGAVDFVARVASGLTGGGSGLVQVRLDSPGGTPIGDFAIDNTGGWQSWRSVPGNVARPTGVHDVYLTFTSAVTADFVAINWFVFRT